jgi:ribosomal protein S27AE
VAQVVQVHRQTAGGAGDPASPVKRKRKPADAVAPWGTPPGGFYFWERGEGMEIIIKRRACPRCRGDLAFNQDHYGTYWGCLACGHHVYS